MKGGGGGVGRTAVLHAAVVEFVCCLGMPWPLNWRLKVAGKLESSASMVAGRDGEYMMAKRRTIHTKIQNLYWKARRSGDVTTTAPFLEGTFSAQYIYIPSLISTHVPTPKAGKASEKVVEATFIDVYVVSTDRSRGGGGACRHGGV